MPNFSKLSLAMAMAVTGLTGTSMLLPLDAAHAQRKKKEEAPKGPTYELSKEYRAAFAEAQKLLAAEDTAGALANLEAANAIATTVDEKYLAGQLYVQLGVKLNDEALQKKGLEGVLGSGRATQDETMKFSTFLGEKAFVARDFAGARKYLKQAIDAGQNNSVTFYQLGETYLSEAITNSGGKTVNAANAPLAREGLVYLKRATEGQIATNGQYASNWAKRGFDISRIIGGNAMDWAEVYVKADTANRAWGDVVRAVQSQNRNYTADQNLDAMRLLREAGAMTSVSDYSEYVDAANAVRRPVEVLAVIEEGKQKGAVSASNVAFTEQAATAKRVLNEYTASLPESISDSRGGATANITLATADALLSSNKPAEAEEIAGVALTKGVEDKDRAYMLRGIARLKQGNMAGAKEDMAAVSGVRKPVAELWTMYINLKSAPKPAAAPAASAQ